jgi:hypothetical protein
MSYHQLSAVELSVLEALGERPQHQGFAPIELPGACPELVAVTVCRLMRKGLIDATPDGVPGDLTEEGRDWINRRRRLSGICRRS